MDLAQSFILRKAGEYMKSHSLSFNRALELAEAHFPAVARRAKGNN